MAKTFKLGRLDHLSSAVVKTQCIIADAEKTVITDECAVTVASYYQSAGATGAAFAALASGAEWYAAELLDNIWHSQRHDIPGMPPTEAASAALQLRMLQRWVAKRADLWEVTIHFQDGSRGVGVCVFYKLQDMIFRLKNEKAVADETKDDIVGWVEIR